MRAVRPTVAPDADAQSVPTAAPHAEAADTRAAVDVRRFRAEGDHAAARERFDLLVDLHQTRALRVALRYLRHPDAAEDVVQEAFLKAYTHIDSYRECWPFQTWFTTILVRCCLDRRKRHLRQDRWVSAVDPSTLDALAGTPSPAAPSPEAVLLADEQRVAIAAAIGQLRGQQRTVFVDSQVHGRSTREIADALDVAESTVRVHLHRAVRTLRTIWGARG